MKRISWIFDIGVKRFDDASSRGPGWSIHMAFFCIMAVGCVFCFSFNLPLGWVFAIFLILGLFDFFGTWYLLRQNVRNVRRLWPFGLLRPRFWIELSAVLLTIGFSCGLFAISGGAAGLVNWQRQLFRPAMELCSILINVSCVITAFAMTLGVVLDRRARGKSLEFVAFFFWCIVGSKLFELLTRQINIGPFAFAIVLISVLLLVVAGPIAWWRSKSVKSQEITTD